MICASLHVMPQPSSVPGAPHGGCSRALCRGRRN
uniref:Uncharacterized protein n=1 Tax=Arundo donax TaxID=35708 RepID=A0A0A9G2Q5_ARUDO